MSSSAQNRISVALCTYNGEQFLPQQLASIEQQTRPPDELVVCDDRSTDRSLGILREFGASVSFPVKITQNSETLGSTKNFEQAIRLCSGDLIALTDQDDIWYPKRLERSEQEFVAHPEAGLVFSDADVMDEQDRPLGDTLWRRLGFVGKRRQDLLAGRFGVLAKHRFVTGATVTLRADLRDRYLPIGEGWIHDEWIALITAAFADLRLIDEPLIRYRIHTLQQVGLQNKLVQRAQGRTRGERHWERLAESVKELQQMCDALSAMVLDSRRDVLPAYRRHLQFLLFRSGLPESRWMRFVPVLTHYAGYEVHASGFPSVVKDLVF
jgi:glycosyltransferase involved in cell wall biosynthesis